VGKQQRFWGILTRVPFSLRSPTVACGVELDAGGSRSLQGAAQGPRPRRCFEQTAGPSDTGSSMARLFSCLPLFCHLRNRGFSHFCQVSFLASPQSDTAHLLEVFGHQGFLTGVKRDLAAALPLAPSMAGRVLAAPPCPGKHDGVLKA